MTAASIATLRPLFQNFLLAPYFGNKQKRPQELESRDSADSNFVLRPGSGQNLAYSAEFAMMMGLRDTGVTTTITAGGKEGAASKSAFRNRRSKIGVGKLWAGKDVDNNTSQTELNKVRTQEEGRAGVAGEKDKASEDDPWLTGIMGITKTTVITTEQ